MPLPKRERLLEYATKGVELGLRTVAQAPEQRQARRLRAQAGDVGEGDGTRVLMVSPRDWAEHVQYQGVIAQALRVRGADVRFLTCGGGLEVCDRANTYEAPPMPCRTCTRYVDASIDAHGFERGSMRELWAPADPGDWPELDAVSTGDLLEVEADGLPLGRIVDIPLKWFLCAADLDDDPLTGQLTRAFLRSARRIAQSLETALDRWQPDVVVVLSGLFLFEGVAWELCRRRGVDVVTYERAFLKETLVFSRERPAGFYDFSEAWPRVNRPLDADEDKQLDSYLEDRRRGKAFDQFWTFDERNVDRGGGRLAVLFTNLTWDTAVIGRDAAFEGIRSWIDHVVAAFEARPEHRLVIRIHPSELHLPGKQTRDSLEAYLRHHHPSLPPNIDVIAADDLTSSYPLMAAADVGLVYTSTTGLELALMGTPVLVSGETHYRGKGFTIDVSSPEEFLVELDRALDSPESGAPDVDLARRYAHFFFFRAPVGAPGVVEPLPGMARITVGSLDDLAPGRDPDLDRICAGILDGRDFV
jgi:hypothetical protein